MDRLKTLAGMVLFCAIAGAVLYGGVRLFYYYGPPTVVVALIVAVIIAVVIVDARASRRNQKLLDQQAAALLARRQEPEAPRPTHDQWLAANAELNRRRRLEANQRVRQHLRR